MQINILEKALETVGSFWMDELAMNDAELEIS